MTKKCKILDLSFLKYKEVLSWPIVGFCEKIFKKFTNEFLEDLGVLMQSLLYLATKNVDWLP